MIWNSLNTLTFALIGCYKHRINAWLVDMQIKAHLSFSILKIFSFSVLDFLFPVFCSRFCFSLSVLHFLLRCLIFFIFSRSNIPYLLTPVFSSTFDSIVFLSNFLFFLLNFLLAILFQLYSTSHPFFVFLFSVLVPSWRDFHNARVITVSVNPFSMVYYVGHDGMLLWRGKQFLFSCFAFPSLLFSHDFVLVYFITIGLCMF